MARCCPGLGPYMEFETAALDVEAKLRQLTAAERAAAPTTVGWCHHHGHAPYRGLYLGFPPSLDRRRSRPASERATERARLRIAQRGGDFSDWNVRGIEQLARCFEARFIQQFLE